MIRRKNIFDRIGSLIPGYKGYSEREGRRNTDKVLREEISKKMYEIEKKINCSIEDAIIAKDFVLMKNLEKSRKKINTLNSKIKYSPQGSTGFFSDEEIKEDELLKVYEIDLDIFNLINQIAQKIMDENFVVIENLLKDFEKIIFDRSIFISKF
tara:strand:+ start:1519 stop:1980 length:462 start_codon:yes stop_codon:yes gene_type:complete